MDESEFFIEENEKLREELRELQTTVARLRTELAAARRGMPAALAGATTQQQEAWRKLDEARRRGDQPHAIVAGRNKTTEFDGRVLLNSMTAESLVSLGIAVWYSLGSAPGGVPHGVYLVEEAPRDS